MRSAFTRVLTLSLGLLFSNTSGWAQEEQAAHDDHRALAQRAAEDLVRFGFHIDLSRIEFVSTSKREFRKEALAQFEQIYPPGQLESLCVWLQGFGIWNFDDAQELKKVSARGLAQVALAYYRTGKQAVAMIDQDGGPLEGLFAPDVLLAHELVHAWRDQDSNLKTLMIEGNPTREETNLRLCLLEGEAQFVMNAVQVTRMGGNVAELTPNALDNTLATLLGADVLAMAYDFGARYAAALWQDGGWDAVRGSWDSPPPSTEQLLHPEKLGVDEPQLPTLPAWPESLPAAELVRSDCMGEMQIYALIRLAGRPAQEARIAAAGWDGDRLDHYRTDTGESALLWRIVWDRELDAQQFYEALAKEGDGEWRIDGCVVDWVRVVDGELAEPLLEALAAHSEPDQRGARDAETTEAVEAAWEAELDDEPFVSGERWIHPKDGYSIPIPDGWKVGSKGAAPLLSGKNTDGGDCGLLPISASSFGVDRERSFAETLAQFERMNFEVLSDERRIVDGQEVLWVEVTSDFGIEMTLQEITFLRGQRQVTLTFSMWGKPSEAGARLAEELFAGLRFGVEDFTRPEPEVQSKVQSLPLEQHATLTFTEEFSGAPLADEEVWIAATSVVSYSDHDERKAKLLRRRGRHYRTDASGQVRVSFRGHGQWVFAQANGSVASNRVVLDQGVRQELKAFPLGNLVVRVVDEQGKPQRRVPVGILKVDRGLYHLEKVRVTHSRRGEVEWKQVFNQLSRWSGGNAKYYVTFAFPVADPQRVRIRPRDDLSEPIILTMPPTGELVVRMDPDSAALDEDAETYGADPERKLYLTRIIDSADPWDVEHDAPQRRLPKELRDEPDLAYYPYVGLGLELDVSPGSYEYERRRIAGPKAPGERVEVTLEPHLMRKPTIEGEAQPMPPALSRGEFTIRFVDEAGEPVAGVTCEVSLTLLPSSLGEGSRGATSHATWSRTSNEQGEVYHDGFEVLRSMHFVRTGQEFENATASATATAAGFVMLPETELDLSAREVILVMSMIEGHGTLKGILLLPPEIPTTRLTHLLPLSTWLEVVRQTGQGAGVLTERFRRGRIDFKVTALPPGEYRLHVTQSKPWGWGDSMGWEEFGQQSRPAVDVCAPISFELLENQNLVLDPIDLRDALAVYRITLRAPGGEALAPGTIVASGLAGKNRVFHELGPDSELYLLAPPGLESLAVKLSSDEYRDLELVLIDLDSEAVLCSLDFRTISLQLQLDTPAELPEGEGYLQLCLRPVRHSEGGTERNTTHIKNLSAQGASFDLDGPGTWELRWFAVRGHAGRLRRERITTGTAGQLLQIAEDERGQSLTISPPPPEAIDRAFRLLGSN